MTGWIWFVIQSNYTAQEYALPNREADFIWFRSSERFPPVSSVLRPSREVPWVEAWVP